MRKAKTPAKPKKSAGDETPRVRPRLSFPVVAIGASAGGLAAFTELLKALPPKSGMAFVLIQHLEPTHKSALTTLLSRATSMAVVEVSDGTAVKPDLVYVIPPNHKMTFRKGALRLAPRSGVSGTPHLIDDFSISLAEEQGNAAIGVVLSGTGSDGTYGLKTIKAAGGVTFAQDPKTAEWPAMPMSAIAAGSVDFVLAPRRIAAELARVGRHPYLAAVPEVPEGSDLEKVCLTLRSSVGVDFRLYKQATVRRRIARRMALQRIASLNKYARILRQKPEEAQALADDIFIHVTSFFRDPECFQALRKRVLAKLGLKRSAGNPIRVWAPGCSTGEEAYSLAILLLEELGEQVDRIKIQIFGTDIQELAVEHARSGIYTDAAVAGVSPARLKRFFVKVDSGYQIQQFVRDLCVFARHDLAKDPPFSRLDLISCRNVLIYMGPALQKRVLSIFQYALKPGGFLFLGNSESISDESDAFTVQDRLHRIFMRKLVTAPSHGFTPAPVPFPEPGSASQKTSAPSLEIDFRKQAEGALLEHYAPPALIVDSDLHIVHFQGDTSPYLAPATGQPSFHLLKMVRPELVVDLRTAISRARRTGAAVHKDNVQFEHQGHPAAVQMEVRPLKKGKSKQQDLLVVFQKVEPVRPGEEPKFRGAGAAKKHNAHRTEKLEREVASTREHLRALISEHETVREEMRAAHEEAVSSNEELQSTNQELETAKEELQSSNEELVTLNDELQHHNAELNALTHDLTNLLLGVDIPVLVLDAGLRVRRFSPVAGTLLHLIPGDVGRPFSDIASNLNVPNWRELFSKVTGQGRFIEREVSDREGHRYSLRVRPYKTDNKIQGVLVVLLDTDLIYRARDQAQKSGDYARAIVETIHEALLVVDAEFRILTFNRSFNDLFGVSLQDMEHRSFFGPGAGQCNVPRLRELLRDVLSKGTEIKDFELDQNFPQIGRRRLLLNARQIDTTQRILIAIDDVTERKRAQEESEMNASTIRALLDSSAQSVIAVNPDAKIVLANGYTEKMFGYSREQLVGQPLNILVPKEARERHAGHHKAYFANMQSRPMGIGMDLEGRRKDGTQFPVEIGLSAIETAAGKLAVAFVSDITQRRRLEASAQTHAQEVHALAASLLTAQEEERRRVSRELHDQICQQLASLAIDIGGLAVEAPAKFLQERLRTLQARVVKASEETRHIAYELHPSVLDDLGLTASLRGLCKEFSERAKDVTLEFSAADLPAHLPREIASCLYRIAQESLQNVSKHANAKHVSVSLVLKEGSVVLTITDDGVGFDLAGVKGRGGLGLIGMEERARLVNGKLSVTARPGHGTRIALEVPLPIR